LSILFQPGALTYEDINKNKNKTNFSLFTKNLKKNKQNKIKNINKNQNKNKKQQTTKLPKFSPQYKILFSTHTYRSSLPWCFPAT